jgi:hypothetical protein
VPFGSDRIRTSTLPILPIHKALLRDHHAERAATVHGSRLNLCVLNAAVSGCGQPKRKRC